MMKEKRKADADGCPCLTGLLRAVTIRYQTLREAVPCADA